MPKVERLTSHGSHASHASNGPLNSFETPNLGVSDHFTSDLRIFLLSASRAKPFGTFSVSGPANDLIYVRSESGRAMPASKSDPIITELATAGRLDPKKVKDAVKDAVLSVVTSGVDFSNPIDIHVAPSPQKATPDHLTITVTIAVPPIVLESVGIRPFSLEGFDNNCKITCPDSWRIDPSDGSRVFFGGEKYTIRKWNPTTSTFDPIVKTVPEGHRVHQTDLFAFSQPIPVANPSTNSICVLPTRSIKAALDAYQATLFKQGISTMITHTENYPDPGQFTIVITENKRFGKVRNVSL